MTTILVCNPHLQRPAPRAPQFHHYECTLWSCSVACVRKASYAHRQLTRLLHCCYNLLRLDNAKVFRINMRRIHYSRVAQGDCSLRKAKCSQGKEGRSCSTDTQWTEGKEAQFINIQIPCSRWLHENHSRMGDNQQLHYTTCIVKILHLCSHYWFKNIGWVWAQTTEMAVSTYLKKPWDNCQFDEQARSTRMACKTNDEVIGVPQGG